MKKILGMAAFLLLISVPAHGQTGRNSNGGPTPLSFGGGSVGGSSISTNRTRLPYYPSTSFAVSAVSGGDPSFAPSSFLTFDQAVAAGKAAMSIEQKTVAQAAAENSAAQKAKSRVAFVQDGRGNVVSAPQE